MVVAASRPILELVTQIVHRVSVVLPVHSDVASVWLSQRSPHFSVHS